MPLHDFYLLSPAISMVGVAVILILVDAFLKDKGLLGPLAFLGLGLPLGFAVALWGANERGFSDILVVDQFSLFFTYLFIGVVAIVILGSNETAARFKRFRGEYYALILLAASGLMLLASARELITIFLALELSSLSSIALIAFFKSDPSLEERNRSVEGGIKYLVLSAVSSALMLYGMAMVFGITGSTHLDAIGQALPAGRLLENPALLAGVVLIVAGFGFKISSVPFQMWVPDVYQGAPTPVTAFLAVGSKAAGFAVIIRVFYEAFGGLSVDWSILFAVLAVASMAIGNLTAIFQTNLKRLLAYSAIAHAGYILIGVAAVATRIPGGEGLGPQSLLFYLGGYAFTNLGAFFTVLAIAHRTGTYSIDGFAGMAKRSPLLAALLAVCLISLTGLPPTVGFWAKLYLFNAAIQSGLVWLAIAGVVTSVISAYYYLRVVKVMYMNPPLSPEPVAASIPLSFATALATAGVVVFGIVPGFLLDFALRATESFPG